jgi:16S rRNA (cytosine967-C5)-methyltransferase
LSTAAEVIRSASREKPADAVLRETLKRKRELSEMDRAEVSALVFDYYRWQEWVRHQRNVESRLQQTHALAEQYQNNPASISVDDLRSKSVPQWTSSEISITEEWLRSVQHRPRLWLRAKRGQGRALCQKLRHCQPFGAGELADTLEYKGFQDLFRSAEFHSGAFELQDISSQAVGLICAPNPGETWWDSCAGEGGKLLHLSALMENKGLIWASDRAAWRLQKLKRRSARAKVFSYRVAPWNGGPRLPTKTRFDGVLLDAPCSGVGTWQRNPQARWTTTASDIEELSQLQKSLLANTVSALKPGGRLIYSVCTLTRSETDRVADAVEKQFPEMEPLSVVNPLSHVKLPSSRVWIWPQDFGGNGMFIAAWRKRT